MRKVFSVALMAAMLGLVGMTKEAGAAATVTLEFGACNLACVGLGTNNVTVAGTPGQTLRMDIFLTLDTPGGTSGYGFTINYDTDLLNELNVSGGGLMAPVEWAGSDVDPSMAVNLFSPLDGLPLVSESTAGMLGQIFTFESANLTQTLPANLTAYTVGTFSAVAPARYRIGQVFFSVNLAANDGQDIFSGLFGGGDGYLDSLGGTITTGFTFGTAAVNVIPEPGTVSLLGLGLVGLVLAGRRSRRS